MDEIENGEGMHAALKSYSGQRTVPNIYIGGVHVGGNDDTQAKAKNGKLKKLLDSAGVKDH